MEAGLYFHIDARHLPKAEYDYIQSTARKVINGTAEGTPLFNGCSYTGDHFETGGVIITLWWEHGNEPQHEVYDTFKRSGMEESALCKICWEMARVAGFVDAAYRCSPMRPKMNPAAPDNFEYLVVKIALDEPLPFMGFPLYAWD